MRGQTINRLWVTIHLDKDIKIEEKEIFSISNQPHFVACNLTKGRVDFEDGWLLIKIQPSFITKDEKETCQLTRTTVFKNIILFANTTLTLE
jgi:hypothetical protein